MVAYHRFVLLLMLLQLPLHLSAPLAVLVVCPRFYFTLRPRLSSWTTIGLCALAAIMFVLQCLYALLPVPLSLLLVPLLARLLLLLHIVLGASSITSR